MTRKAELSMLPMLAALGAMAMMLSGLAMAADPPKPESRPARGGRAGPLVGKPAPDFELPVLKEETNAKGEKVNRITDDKVKLSSLVGKKVIVLFMSSYT